MSRYAAVGETAVGTTLAILQVSATAAVRPKVYDIMIGSDATPADLATDFIVCLHTAAGSTGTAFTATLLDPISAAAACVPIAGTFGTPPTMAASGARLKIHLNQRATFRWVAAPGSELTTLAATTAGIVLQSIASGGTYNCGTTFLWYE
jgi:hypothetical protein